MAKNCIGLDIGSSSIKAVQIKSSKSGIQLLNYGIEPLLPQTIVDGTIMDQGTVVDAIRTLWSRLKFRRKEVAIAIAGHSVIIKKFNLPPMTEDELEMEIPNQIQHIPFGKDAVEVDYQVLSEQNASGQMEVVLVAAKKETVYDYAQVVRDASLLPAVVDVAAFSAQNAFEANYTLEPNETIVIVNIGAAISNINIVRDGVSLFTRDVTIGGNSFTEEIIKQLNVSQEEAEGYKVSGSFGDQGAAVEQILESVAEVMAGEFQRSLDFFLATAADTNVSRICLSGGTAKVAPLHRAIERRSRLNVEVLSPWTRMQVDSKLDPTFLAAHAPEAMVAVGLALRTPHDR